MTTIPYNIIRAKQPIRKVWESEASDFTPWVSNNIKEISDVVGFELRVLGEEVSAINFRADILAEVKKTHEKVIIENMFGKSDHDHIGKCLTYMSNLGAKICILICEELQEAHRKTYEMLNKITPSDYQFFVIQCSAFIVSDQPLYALNLILEPSEEEKEEEIEQEVEEAKRNRDFWNKVINKLSIDKKPKTAYRRGIGMNIKARGCGLSFYFHKRSLVQTVSLVTSSGEESAKQIRKYTAGLKEESGRKNADWISWKVTRDCSALDDLYNDESVEWFAKKIEEFYKRFKDLTINM
ncbi:MAG: hypothetical protein MJZ41_11395 [Bacteroidaceae bacterium]|nr:hypothetical protein [Bacteroidaceae bacterium]